MTRDEYLHVLATEPATSTQVGAVIGEFERLGVVDRGERLAISAALLGLEELGSTTDLVMGDAGRLYRMLLGVRDRAELPDVTAAVDEHQGDDAPMTIPEAILRIAAMVYAAWQGDTESPKFSSVSHRLWRAGGAANSP